MRVTRPSPAKRSPDPNKRGATKRGEYAREHIALPLYHDWSYLYVDLEGDMEGKLDRRMRDYPWETSTVKNSALRTSRRYRRLGPLAKVPTASQLLAPPAREKRREETAGAKDFLSWVGPPRTAEAAAELEATHDYNRHYMDKDILNPRGDSYSTALKEVVLQIFVRSNAQDGWKGRFPTYDQGMIEYVRVYAPRDGDEFTRLTRIQNLRRLFLAIQFLNPDGRDSPAPRAVSTFGVISPDANIEYTETTDASLPIADAFRGVLDAYQEQTLPFDVAYRVASRMWRAVDAFHKSKTFRAFHDLAHKRDKQGNYLYETLLYVRRMYFLYPDHLMVYRRSDGA